MGNRFGSALPEPGNTRHGARIIRAAKGYKPSAAGRTLVSSAAGGKRAERR